MPKLKCDILSNFQTMCNSHRKCLITQGKNSSLKLIQFLRSNSKNVALWRFFFFKLTFKAEKCCFLTIFLKSIIQEKIIRQIDAVKTCIVNECCVLTIFSKKV